jgi:hypothetical protein
VAAKPDQVVDDGVHVLGINRRFVSRAHLLDLGMPLGFRQGRLIERYPGGVAVGVAQSSKMRSRYALIGISDFLDASVRERG